MTESTLTILDTLSYIALAVVILGTASLIHGMVNHGKQSQQR